DGSVTQFFQMRREDFLLVSETRIQREEKFVPGVLTPREFLVFRKQPGGRIYFGACSAREVEKRGAVIIGGGPLQRVTDRRAECEKPDRRRCTCKRITKRQMNVNAREHQMIGNAVNDSAFAAFLVS